MAVTNTPRLGLTRWSAGTDPLTRLQLDGDHARLEDRATMFVRGTLAARPAAGTIGRIYEVTGDATASNNGRLFWDTGSAWQEVSLVHSHPYEPSGAVADHAAAADPHPGYATDSDLTNHAGAADPHPVYETGAEAQARVDAHADTAQPDRHLSLAQSLRGGAVNMSHAFNVSFSAGEELSWGGRIIIISAGRGPSFAGGGYFEIRVPAAGVVITGVGGATNKTVTAAGIPLGGWHALYYILPIGGTQTSVDANFRIVNYTSASEIPAHWVLIGVRNGDAPNLVHMWDGRRLAAGDTLAAQPAAGGDANTMMRRDSAGRAQVAAPNAAADILRLAELTAHTDAANPHNGYLPRRGVTAVAEVERLIQRIDNRRSMLTYNAGGDLTRVQEQSSDGVTTVKTTDLAYDANGNLTSTTETVGGRTITTTLNYDANGNLTSTTRSVA